MKESKFEELGEASSNTIEKLALMGPPDMSNNNLNDLNLFKRDSSINDRFEDDNESIDGRPKIQSVLNSDDKIVLNKKDEEIIHIQKLIQETNQMSESIFKTSEQFKLEHITDSHLEHKTKLKTLDPFAKLKKSR